MDRPGSSRPQNTRKTRVFGLQTTNKTLAKHVLLELPDDIAHIKYNNTHAKYVLFVLSPVLTAGFRWVHRAHFLVRQGEKAIASTLQTAKHSQTKKKRFFKASDATRS